MEWRVSVFILALFAFAFGLTWATSDVGLCAAGSVYEALKTSGGPNCAEFWLNRYQALIGAAVTFGAAVIAYVAVQQQVRVARRQLDAATGNVDPQFLLEKGNAFDEFTILVFNLNRMPIFIDRITLTTNDQAITDAEYKTGPGYFRKLGQLQSEQHLLTTLRLPGTAPSAAETSFAEIRLGTTMYGRRIEAVHTGEVAEARFTLIYRVMSPNATINLLTLSCKYEPDITGLEG
jgi:hypothetical protein